MKPRFAFTANATARALLAVLLLALTVFAAWVAWANRLQPQPPAPPAPPIAGFAAERIERGAYLARAGNCMACHTTRGGTPYAGGRGIETPFGVVYAGNLTPDPQTGLGTWSADDFWHALHQGRSKGGRLLYPAFPYPAFTHVTRADSDALYSYLQSLPPVRQANLPHDLRWPTNQAWALAVWRALFFKPEPFQPDSTQDAVWNRGAYLVQGLGHCASCHAPRNAMGATLSTPSLDGGLMPAQGWHAPGLGGQLEAADLVQLLRTGQSPRGAALGPMAEVVLHSTQHLTDADLQAMARYLGTQPEPVDHAEVQARAKDAPTPERLQLGAALYTQHCASCHGEQGDGQGLYPPLKGNRSVNLAAPHNVLQAIRQGGFAPNTAANPRPFGMPPFGHVLTDAELAAVATHIRRSWGNAAPAVTELQVLKAK
jgi:mono/diheme cytochrome c family protein